MPENKGNNRERKNAQDIHPRKVDSVARVDPGDDERRKKMALMRNKSSFSSSSSARTQAQLYFRFLTEQVVAHVLIIFTIVYVYMTMKRYHYRYDSWPTTFITCTEDQPLVKIEENFLNFLEYEKLRKCTLEHPRLNVPSSLSQAAFGQARGFVSKFNEEGVDCFLNHPDFGECFGDLFKKMRAPGMNAYVFNAVVCDLSNYDELKNNKTSIGLHIDQAVGLEGLTDSHQFIAHQVNVFYVDVAPDMIGGELEIWRYGSGDLSNVRSRMPHASIMPQKNKLVSFRGDSFHQVKAYHSSQALTKRLSLVLEQYKIKNEFVPNTVDWMEALKEDMMMM
jgi:hypothetical protein